MDFSLIYSHLQFSVITIYSFKGLLVKEKDLHFVRGYSLTVSNKYIVLTGLKHDIYIFNYDLEQIDHLNKAELKLTTSAEAGETKVQFVNNSNMLILSRIRYEHALEMYAYIIT